jgi:hypothetical protein
MVCLCCTAARAADANRFTYLDDFCNPYYVGLDFPKLTTPQWVGEPGVDAVITLGIDDMREPERYEAYLRPILERLQAIDGRAAVSIMTCSVDPNHPQLQSWLEEGVSLETHTVDHPCPCLQAGDFEKAKSTYDRCVDLLHAVPNNRPVAFRFPCCDSLNTPSPRAFAEIMGSTTESGNFLQASSSVCSIITSADPALPSGFAVDDEGRHRFAKYAPFKSFVNKVYNYPYPFVIGKLIWEFPCAVPDDWQAQNLQRPQNPKTLTDMQAVIDAAVLKQGTANFVFHPYEWIRNDQMAALVDYADRTYGKRVKFLTFRECLMRLNQNLLVGQPLRAATGEDNGVRLLDVNGDGFLDVVIGNERVRMTRVWDPQKESWHETDFPALIVAVAADGPHHEAGARFGVLKPDAPASVLVANDQTRGIWHFDGQEWQRDEEMETDRELNGEPLLAVRDGVDQGLRLRDVDADGVSEIMIAGPSVRAILRWDSGRAAWQASSATVPEPIVDEGGRDAGLRFVDLSGDGHEDIVFSNERRYAVHLWDSAETGWNRQVRAGTRGDANAIPMIAREGTNNGAWFAEGNLWLQNEDTHRLPDGVDRRTYTELLDLPR